MGLEQKSIERIQVASEMSLHYYGKPLICTYSRDYMNFCNECGQRLKWEEES